MEHLYFAFLVYLNRDLSKAQPISAAVRLRPGFKRLACSFIGGGTSNVSGCHVIVYILDRILHMGRGRRYGGYQHHTRHNMPQGPLHLASRQSCYYY